MTASPIDAKVDLVQAASDLEVLLDSRIATTLDMSLTDAVKKPEEMRLSYPPLKLPFETILLKAFKAKFGDIEILQPILETAPEVARQLGAWCADQYLIDSLTEVRLKKYAYHVERKFHSRSDQDVKKLDGQLARLRSAVEYMGAQSKGPRPIRDQDLSSKIHQLYGYLTAQFERTSSHRCIVFVDRREHARLLHLLFQKVGTKHMQCATLIGSQTTNIYEENFTFRQQVLTLMKFRKGELNCLFATSVAEEGLDVPDCNLVIRFDLYKTMIQYVQSRGRARQHNSKFIHMTESNNSFHDELVNATRYQEQQMRRFCQTLPEDRRLVGNEDALEVMMAKEKVMRTYTEPSTGAKLTYGNALAYLANFVSAIPSEGDELACATYSVTVQDSKFVGEVVLPVNAPIGYAVGRPCTKKMLARRSAAFEACLELRRKQFMNEYLMPIYQKKLPAMRNALLAVGMDKSNQYVMRTKPSLWARTRGRAPSELYVTVLDFPDGLETAHQPLLLLTRTSMPELPIFPVYLNDGRPSNVVSLMLQKRLPVQGHILEQISTFTFRMFKDVFSKTYAAESSMLSYWLAPAKIGCSSKASTAPETIIDWTLLNEVMDRDEHKWTPYTSNTSLVDRFLVDKWDGSRKFFSIAIDATHSPLDPVPEGCAKARWGGDILGYSVSLYKNARKQATWDITQPVMRAEKLVTRRNMLAPASVNELSHATKAYLCPEPLRISVLPIPVVTSCLLWPAIIHRFEAYLVALEACDVVGVVCQPQVALAAMTKDSDNSGERESQGRVNFQSGMGDNYERLEFIGDTFLKTATTISTFVQNPNENEFEFHVRRMRLLCNKNLFDVAKSFQLYEYIRSMAFSRRTWYPEGLKLLEGKGKDKREDTAMHTLGQKTIADVCEALIGAAFVSHDRPGQRWDEDDWENAVRAVTKLVGSEDHAMSSWNDYRLAYHKPAYQTGEVTASQRDLAEKVETEHPYHFTYPRLLRSAFIHPSQPHMYEKVPSYQRLEFLGDALLDMASITHLFYRFPDRDPGWLTEHKMAMVSNKFLGAVCVNIGFHKHLRYTHSILEHQIRAYATELLEAKATAGESRDYWTTVSDPPKCLPDIVEAFVGAMFVDADFDYNVVQDFFHRHIEWYFEDMSIYDTFANHHPCTHLHNVLQTTYGCQEYRLMARELPSVGLENKDVVAVVMIHNEVIAHSKGKSGRYARIRVAQSATEMLEGLAPWEFRGKFGCDCHLEGEVKGKDAGIGADCGV